MAAKKTTDAKTSDAKKPAAGDETAKRKPNAGFMKPMQPSADLAKIVGADPIPRTEVTKKVWEYIKKNGLQKGREINADEPLAVVFGGKKTVTMFEMTALVNKHLSNPAA